MLFANTDAPWTMRVLAVLIAIQQYGAAHAQAPEAQDSEPDATEECDETCRSARNARNPLASVRAVFVESSINIGPVDDASSYSFELQPVYSWEAGAHAFILRGVVPVLGVPSLSDSGSVDKQWGLGDSVIQGFYVPPTRGFSIGFGPQVSLRTHTDDVLEGPGFGGGLAVVGFVFAGPVAIGAIINHLWGGKTSTAKRRYNRSFF